MAVEDVEEFRQLDTFGINTALFSHLRFHVHDGIDAEARTALIKKIQDRGGRVRTAIPRRGVIVYDANKSKSFGARWSDSPDRHAVHMTWVDKCIQTNSLVDYNQPMDDEPVPLHITKLSIPHEKRVLMDMVNVGKQLPIHLHWSIKGRQRSKLCHRIEEYGGFCAVLRSQARVILVDLNEDTMDDIARLQNELWDKDVYVEQQHILDRWIKEGNATLTRPPRKGMPGRRPGSQRTEFTPEDDAILIEHIARQIPDPKRGGRLGFNLYEMLEARLKAEAQRYEMERAYNPRAHIIRHAAQHPFQSWRERYRNLQLWFDEQIEAWLDRHEWVRERGGDFPRALGAEKTLNGRKPLQGATPRKTAGTPRKRAAPEPDLNEEAETGAEDNEDEDLEYPPPRRSPNKRRRVQVDPPEGTGGQDDGEASEVDVHFDGSDDEINLLASPFIESQPPPTYRTVPPGMSQLPSSRGGVAGPTYKKPNPLKDKSFPPPRAPRPRVDVQIPDPEDTPRRRSQAPEPPTPYPVARSTPRSTLASPLGLPNEATVFSPPAPSNNHNNGEGDTDSLEVEAELDNGSGSGDVTEPTEPRIAEAARGTSLSESSQATVEAPSPEPGVLVMLEETQALHVDVEAPNLPHGPRVSEVLPPIRQLDFNELPADETRYPGGPRRSSGGNLSNQPRRSRGRVSINDVVETAQHDRAAMASDLTAAHGFVFSEVTVRDVLQEHGDDYDAANRTLIELTKIAAAARARIAAQSRTDTETGDYRPAPRTRAAAIRRVQDQLEEERPPSPPLPRRTRAAVAAGRVPA